MHLNSAKRTGGGITNITQFSPLDARLVALMGGQRFATGDPGLSVHPVPNMVKCFNYYIFSTNLYLFFLVLNW